jgi:uncharacterized protein
LFCALPIGPLQKNLNTLESAKIIELALDMGINFIDTAQIYKTYEPIALAMKNSGIRPIIARYSPQRRAIIYIFHLHAAKEGANAFELFTEALEC